MSASSSNKEKCLGLGFRVVRRPHALQHAMLATLTTLRIGSCAESYSPIVQNQRSFFFARFDSVYQGFFLAARRTKHASLSAGVLFGDKVTSMCVKQDASLLQSWCPNGNEN